VAKSDLLKGIQSLSLVAKGSRNQFGVALAALAVIPALTVVLIQTHDPLRGCSWVLQILVTLLLVALASSGYRLLIKYPNTLIKLRRHLEQMISSENPERISLLKWEDDITVIERSLNLIVDRLNSKITTMSQELGHVEWLLTRNLGTGTPQQERARRRQAFLVQAGEAGVDTGMGQVEREVFEDVLGDALDLTEHAAGAFDEDGQCVLHILASRWCRKLGETGGLQQLSGCAGQEAARAAITLGQPTEADGLDGIRFYAVPVFAGERAVGALCFGHGQPPTSAEAINTVAARTGLDREELGALAKAYEPRPPYVVALAKNRLQISARLLGEVIDRKRAELVLRGNEEELLRHRQNLEERVDERTRELREANERLQKEIAERRRAEQLKDDFISTVSHELRTPLSIAREGVSLLIDRIPGDLTAKQEHLLDVTAANLSRLTRIVNDILDMSRIEAGKLTPQWERVDLCGLVRQTLVEFELSARRKGLALRAVLPPDPLSLYADPRLASQVFSNLVGNAIKFTAQGEVTVTLTDRGDGAECTVADTGVGISPEHQQRLFRKFEQFHRVEGSGERGTGLGLAIARQLVELHGGTIRAASEVGRGTTFTFTLPRCTPEQHFVRALTDLVRDAAREHRTFVLVRMHFEGRTPDDASAVNSARLAAIARELKVRRIIREHDSLFVYGEAEVLLVAWASRQDVEGLMRRVNQAVARLLDELRGEDRLWAQYQWAVFPDDAGSAADLLAKAGVASKPAGG
jgi:signal transduction histidine kinase